MKPITRLGMVPAALLAIWAIIPEESPSIPFDEWTFPYLPSRSPPHSMEDDPGPIMLDRKKLLQSDDFEFAMGVGSGWHGLDVFRVKADGFATYVFQSASGGGGWWKADLRIPPEQVARLRQLLSGVDYPSLKRSYMRKYADGTQWCILVSAGGVSKKVYCNNYFPAPAQQLANFVGNEFLKPRENEIRKARRIWESTAESAAADLWR